MKQTTRHDQTNVKYCQDYCHSHGKRGGCGFKLGTKVDHISVSESYTCKFYIKERT